MAGLVAAFVIYTAGVIGVGLFAGRRTKAQSDDYFLAKRELGPWLSALSSGASGSSAWAVMGLVGLAFASGLRAYWLIPGVLIGITFNWFVLAKRMRSRSEELGAVTVPDLLSMHYGERFPLLRFMSVAVILSAMFLYVAAQMAAAGQMFSFAFPGLSYRSGVGIGVAIVLAYTVVGGFRATCWTDMLQSLAMLLALAGMPIVLLVSGAPGDAPISALEGANPALVSAMPEVSGLALIGFLFGSGALGINLGYPGQPHVLVRLMALKDARQVPFAGAVQIAWTTIIYSGAITTGVLVRASAASGTEWASAITDDTQELSLIIAATELLPSIVAAFVLAAMVSAMASTADSQLIVAASAVSSDGYERLVSKGKSALSPWLNRGAVLALGLGAGLLVLDQQVTVYTYVLTYGWAILGASFGPQIALVLLWKRSTYAGCVVGMASGFIVTILWKQLSDRGIIDLPFYNLTVAFVASTLAHTIVSLFTARQSETR